MKTRAKNAKQFRKDAENQKMKLKVEELLSLCTSYAEDQAYEFNRLVGQQEVEITYKKFKELNDRM